MSDLHTIALIPQFPLHRAGEELARLRAAAPLVHCLSNEVVQSVTANVLLALGASPAMIVAEEEVAEFAAMADALLINVGTLYPARLAAMKKAVAAANAAGTPWALDPVAAGVLSYRTDALHDLLKQRPAVIRGNASEIMCLAGEDASGKGVDSTAHSALAIAAAQRLARQTGAIVAVTGEVDYVSDGEVTWAVPWGHALMTRVVGTGCALSAVTAAFVAGATDRLAAVAAACAVMSIAGERAESACDGPGTFLPAFLDALYIMQPAMLKAVDE
ncbi:hydroxyethylthiazole kinase [Iodobacter sp. HSC-16F04]|uniref:Hydroxyethylthiazole kinase n=1 Tax=Iodobacter violaceini TaxID=3044271 RepID=A0ABX0KTK8_9NEIS|nr:hydroxyethylthiazole kinase [Iodobacter violacea]NHQ85452.1 hydroxyethylthiazole kinase [Iodobacter violacea]